jgi:hypothetical protein
MADEKRAQSDDSEQEEAGADGEELEDLTLGPEAAEVKGGWNPQPDPPGGH